MSRLFCRDSLSMRLPILAFCLCALISPASAGLAADSVAQPSSTQTEKRPEGWKFNNEQDWIVDSTGRDIAEILAYAARPSGDRGRIKSDEVSFSVKCTDPVAHTYVFQYGGPSGQQNKNITMSDYIWSTKNYEPLAKAILESSKLEGGTASAMPADFVKTLANADWKGLLAENDIISAALSANPLDPTLHEEAALLMAAFTMQDECGSFTDFRPALERICAHLTLARIFSNDKLGESGKLAEIFEECFCGRTADAVAHIDTLAASTQDAATQSWLRALKIHCTCDYRLFDQKNQTAIEERQYAVRYSINRAGLAIIEYMQKNHQHMTVQDMRCVLNTNHTVEAGHMASARIVPAELSAFMEDCVQYKRVTGNDFEKASVELNLLPTRCLMTTVEQADIASANLQVISWNDVAAFHMRHILNAIGGEHYFYQYLYGVPEMAKNTIAQSYKFLGKVDQLPFATRFFDLSAEQKRDRQKGMAKFLSVHSEAVTAWNWPMKPKDKDSQEPQFGMDSSLPSPVPAELWFDPPMPFGTAYFFTAREGLRTFKGDVENLSALHALNPYHENIATALVKAKYGEHPTADQYNEIFGKLNDYNLQTMRTTAEAAVEEPDKNIPLEEKMAAFEPMTYLGMGNYCVLFERPEQAAKYYQLGMEKCDDAVVRANSSPWLIRYWFEHGQKAKAAELATFAGDVYSRIGLLAQGWFYEKSGDLKKAEETYRGLEERYETKSDLLAFLIRNSEKQPVFRKESAAQVQKLFPNGLKKVTLADFKAPPERGLLVEKVDEPHAASPFKKGMIIVAANGYLVQTKEQNDVLRFVSLERYLTAIVWDGKKYLAVKRPYANMYNLGVDVKDYRAPATKK